MRNIKLVLQYDGTRYQGWQKQVSTGNTIQGKLEELLSRMTGEKTELAGSGRTDAGVHAARQVANFHTSAALSAAAIKTYMNQYLPEDIRVLSVQEAAERFHSRLNAREKIYQYRICNSETADVFTRKYTYHYAGRLDLNEMRRAAELMCGTHDFKAFCTNKRFKKSTVRTVSEITIEQHDTEIQLTYRGNGFLYHMVRIMTGTLLEIGCGKRQADSIQALFASKNREEAGELVPGQGLTLLDVIY